LTTLSVTWLSPPLLGTRESSSSKNMIQGYAYLAFWNIDLTAFSLSPTYLLRISGPFTEIKLALAWFDKAQARRVLPQPGGPYNKTPPELLILNFSNFSGFRIGNRTDSSSSFLRFYKAPIYSKFISPLILNPSLVPVG